MVPALVQTQSVQATAKAPLLRKLAPIIRSHT